MNCSNGAEWKKVAQWASHHATGNLYDTKESPHTKSTHSFATLKIYLLNDKISLNFHFSM